MPRGRRRLLRTRLRLNLLLTLRRRSWRRFVLWRRRLLRTRLWLNLLLMLRRRSRGRLVLRWRRLLRMRLRLNLLLMLWRRSRGRLVLRWRRLLRMRLRLNLLLMLWRRCLGRPVLRRRLRRTSLRLCLRLNLPLAGGWWGRRSSRRLICRRLIAIRLNVLLSRVGLPGCVWLRGGRCRARSWGGTREESLRRWVCLAGLAGLRLQRRACRD